MAVFEYQAIARSGKSVKGVIDADSAAAARRELRTQELSPTKLTESFGKEDKNTGEGGSTFSRISNRDLSLMTRQLAVLLDAGMPLVEALGALLDQTANAKLRKTIYDVRAKVNEGVSLGQAMAGHPRVFNDLFTNMVAAGETSGALEAVLLRLADIQERQLRLRNKVRAALAYPIIMALIGAGIITFLMGVIVPKIVIVFEKQKVELPTVTKTLIAASTFLKEYWWFVGLLVIAAYALFRFWVSRPSGRRVWDRFKLKVPVYGTLYTMMLSAQFGRTLGSMLESGLTMLRSLDVVRTVVQNQVVDDALNDVKAEVRRGRDLAQPLKESGLFPPMLIHMTDLGQRSGQLESMLTKIADTYEEDVEMSVDALVSLLEPLMIVVMGLFVGYLVISILLPILSMSTNV
jgi:general secretion pathway protein F